MTRPIGVTLFGIFMIVAGIGFAVAGVLFFVLGSTGASATAPTNGPMATLLTAVGAAAGVVFLVFGGLHIVLAFGIFKLRNIARVLTIFLFAIIGIGALLGLAATIFSYSHVGLIWNSSLLVVDALALWYLLRPATKEAFTA
jgi:hypothetical protein